MVVSTIQEAVENGAFKHSKITTKKIDTGSLVFVNFLFEMLGKVSRPLFEGPELYFPRGAKLNEHNKWTGLGVHSREIEECMNMAETEEHSRKVGWCRKSLVNLEMDIGNATASPKDGDVEVHVSPDSDAVSFVLHEGESVKVDGKQKIGKTEYVKLVTEGTKGYIQCLQHMQAEVLFEKKDELNLQAETVEDVQKMFKHPIYWPINKETKKLDDSRDPSEFPQFMFYKDSTQENYAEITMAGSSERLSPSDLENVSFKGIPIYDYSRVFVKAGDRKIMGQVKIRAFVITHLEEFKRPSIQENTLARVNAQVSQEQQAKNLEILRKARQASPQAEETAEAGSKESTSSGGDDDLDAIMNGSVSESVEIGLGDDLPEVPGL